ncbi:hypothetical protein [Treponema pedis]|nr:hypothetical protein [Treponema pedis]
MPFTTINEPKIIAVFSICLDKNGTATDVITKQKLIKTNGITIFFMSP